MEVFSCTSVSIENLDLSWNRIYLPGALILAELIKKDFPSLRVLDLAWNCLSKAPPLDAKQEALLAKKASDKRTKKNYVEEAPEAMLGNKWGEALAFNTKLVHLDLSFNRIDYHDSLALSKGIVENQTLFGLHYQGNMGRIDSLGYLHPIEEAFFQNPRTWHFS